MDTEGVVLLTASGFYGNSDTVVYRRNTTKLLGSNVTIQIGSRRTEAIARVQRRNKSMIVQVLKGQDPAY